MRDIVSTMWIGLKWLIKMVVTVLFIFGAIAVVSIWFDQIDAHNPIALALLVPLIVAGFGFVLYVIGSEIKRVNDNEHNYYSNRGMIDRIQPEPRRPSQTKEKP